MDLHSKFATEDIGFMNTQYCFVRKNFDFLRVKEIESVSNNCQSHLHIVVD